MANYSRPDEVLWQAVGLRGGESVRIGETLHDKDEI
jgi:hypothetical protein